MLRNHAALLTQMSTLERGGDLTQILLPAVMLYQWAPPGSNPNNEEERIPSLFLIKVNGKTQNGKVCVMCFSRQQAHHWATQSTPDCNVIPPHRNATLDATGAIGLWLYWLYEVQDIRHTTKTWSCADPDLMPASSLVNEDDVDADITSEGSGMAAGGFPVKWDFLQEASFRKVCGHPHHTVGLASI